MKSFQPSAYRDGSETPIFLATVLLIMVILAIAAGSTLCLVPLLVGITLLISIFSNQQHHKALMQAGRVVTPSGLPGLSGLLQELVNVLRPGRVQFFVLPAKTLNAYTFGLSDPKVVVLHESLFDVMDEDEIRFIVGHELGHVALGHTWLNTLITGMASMPTSIGVAVVFNLAFHWWSRACEFSADRAGLLACGSLNKSISALAQIVGGDIRNQREWQQVMAAIEAEDDSWGNLLGEAFSTHPMMVRRIKALKQFAASAQYRRLTASN